MGLLPDDHVYSYSQLSQVAECPYAFYLQRIEGLDQKGNAFASQGTLIHDLIDQWAKGTIKREDLLAEYISRYPEEVREPWPKRLVAQGFPDKTYQSGIEYFENFDGFEGYKILETETRFKTNIEGRPLVGVVDMVLEDGDGKLIVCDHKSKSLKSFEKSEDEMYRQQLLYANHVLDKFGQFPDVLMFNLFKENGLKKTRPFTEDDYQKAMDWAFCQIRKVEEFELLDWLDVHHEPGGFFCAELCSVRGNCSNGKYLSNDEKEKVTGVKRKRKK